MHEALTLLARVPSILAFLFALTIVAECCAVSGVFDAVATSIVKAGRSGVTMTWLLFMAVTALVTCLLSLDTTAVLMTSAAVVVARKVRAPVAMFAFPTLWLANMGSLWLPVSNLTNLLAREHLPSSGAVGFLRFSWPVALTTTVVPLLCAAVIWREWFTRPTSEPSRGQDTACDSGAAPARTNRTGSPHDAPPTHEPRERQARIGIGVVTTLMCVALLMVEPWMAASAAALVSILILLSLTRPRVRDVALPWHSLFITTGLFASVAALHGSGALNPLVDSLRDAPTAVLVLSAGALANATNNLPTYLALEPAARDEAARLLALLVGVNVTSGLTWWGSVATLLWRDRLRRDDVTVSLRQHLVLTGSVTVLTTAAALAVLALTH